MIKHKRAETLKKELEAFETENKKLFEDVEEEREGRKQLELDLAKSQEEVKISVHRCEVLEDEISHFSSLPIVTEFDENGSDEPE